MSSTGQLFANCEMAPKLCMEFFFLEFWQTSENKAARFLLGMMTPVSTITILLMVAIIGQPHSQVSSHARCTLVAQCMQSFVAENIGGAHAEMRLPSFYDQSWCQPVGLHTGCWGCYSYVAMCVSLAL